MSTSPHKTSPRREPPKSPAPPTTPQGLGGMRFGNAGVAAYNSWYNTMNSEWAWLIYTVIIVVLLILGVFVYNTFMYPSASPTTPAKLGVDGAGYHIDKIPAI